MGVLQHSKRVSPTEQGAVLHRQVLALFCAQISDIVSMEDNRDDLSYPYKLLVVRGGTCGGAGPYPGVLMGQVALDLWELTG